MASTQFWVHDGPNQHQTNTTRPRGAASPVTWKLWKWPAQLAYLQPSVQDHALYALCYSEKKNQPRFPVELHQASELYFHLVWLAFVSPAEVKDVFKL